MTKRRMGTVPHRIFWTPQLADRIEAYQVANQIPSFSAAAEALVRTGLEQSPGEVITPIIVSTIRRELAQGLERLIRLQLYTAIEAGIGQRLAGAAVRDIGRVKKDDPERYQRIRQVATKETRKRLGRAPIADVIAELYQEFAPEASGSPVGVEGADGNYQE